MSDFCVPGTRYKRLSKLVLMIVKSGETCRMMQKVKQLRLRYVGTTAFTDKPVSMKYRGVFKLAKRGETLEGQKYINYEAEFDALSWQEVLKEWWTRHGSIT